MVNESGFGGLVISILAPGTRVQNPQHAFLRKGSKAVSTLKKAKFVGHFSPELSSFANRGLCTRAARGSTEGSTLVQHGCPWSWWRKLKEQHTEDQCNTGLGAYGATWPLYQSTKMVNETPSLETTEKFTTKYSLPHPVPHNSKFSKFI
jgi:hypothetical protein